MNDDVNVARRPLGLLGLFLLGSLLFSAAYCQAPLYYSNQNQYFLHGLANAGDGFLRDDWLAQTGDPTPLFSGMISLTARTLHPWVFHLYHALLQGVYLAALVGIFAFVVGPEIAARRWPVFVMSLVAIHSALLRWLSYRYLGLDYPWYFQVGVAAQYVLGAMLQPSVFGVLLVAAVSLFVHGRPYWAIVAIAAGATMHSTYLLPGALLTAGFMAAQLCAGRPRFALLLGALALLLVLPVTIYVLVRFSPTSPDAFAEAQDILVNFRIPHHARPDLWFDTLAGLQVAWIAMAVLLVRRTTLFLTLLVPFALATLLTILQAATGQHTLALLFPWRISAVLLPIATAILVGRVVALPYLPCDGKAVLSAAVVCLLATAGIWIVATGQAFRTPDEEAGMVAFVRESCAQGDVYLLPVSVPKLAATTRGSLSGDFKPRVEKKTESRLIPPDLQRFRLSAGAPIFVDFKAIPYKDVEVIEWHKRLLLAQGWYRDLRAGHGSEVIPQLREYRITHVVESASQSLTAPELRQVYADEFYKVYRIVDAK